MILDESNMPHVQKIYTFKQTYLSFNSRHHQYKIEYQQNRKYLADMCQNSAPKRLKAFFKQHRYTN